MYMQRLDWDALQRKAYKAPLKPPQLQHFHRASRTSDLSCVTQSLSQQFMVPSKGIDAEQQDMVPSKGINAEQQRLLANF